MIDICYYSSDYYAPYTGISMFSLLENNRDLDFRLHCIDSGISEINQSKMLRMVESFGKELIFHDYSVMEEYIRDELMLPICNGSYATYIKVFPDRIFPDCERMLFIDGDTLINGSLRGLFETDLSESLFAAVKVSLINENWVYKENDPNNLRLKYSLKFKDTGYYNIGVFLVNLKRWKELDFGSLIMKMAEKHLSVISEAEDVPIDEMLINLAALELHGGREAAPLSAVYNCVTHSIPYKRARQVNRRCGYIDMDDFDKAYYHPVIIHFCIFKPWISDAYSAYYPLLRQYRQASPWPDAFTENKYHSFPQKVFGKFFYPLQNEEIIRISKKIWETVRKRP